MSRKQSQQSRSFSPWREATTTNKATRASARFPLLLLISCSYGADGRAAPGAGVKSRARRRARRGARPAASGRRSLISRVRNQKKGYFSH